MSTHLTGARAIAVILALAAGVLAADPALADADGGYCVGPNYIAYQLFDRAERPRVVHRLTVVQMGSDAGIRVAGVLELPTFQVHGILCGRDWIELGGWDAVYHVTLDPAYRPTFYMLVPHRPGEISREFVASEWNNLGNLGGMRAYWQPIHVRIGQTNHGSAFYLDVTATPVSPEKPCELNARSRIVQLDQNGRELEDLVVYDGKGLRECGE